VTLFIKRRSSQSGPAVAIAPKRSSFQAFVGKIQVFGSVVLIAAITYGTLTRVGLLYALYFKLAPWRRWRD